MKRIAALFVLLLAGPALPNKGGKLADLELVPDGKP